MCNDYRLEVDAGTIADDFSDIKIKIRFGEGKPNIQARQDIKITDTAPIVRTVIGDAGEADRTAGDLVQRRWSWPGPGGRPVYNFRSDGREFASGRCLIVADGFYEFTTPADAKKKRKDKWLFTKRGEGRNPVLVSIGGAYCRKAGSRANTWRKPDRSAGAAMTLPCRSTGLSCAS